jgi:peptide/nickel transport system substrate-binding protein
MLILAAAVLVSLTSCIDPVAAPSPSDSAEPQPSATVASAGAIDHMFTIRYDADHTFNPITGTDPNNMALAPLMYESLFVLSDTLTAEPVLCDDCKTTDGLTYTIKLKPDVAMSDGATLSSADVKYTLTTAMQGGRFSGRLSIVGSVSAVDALTLKITLKSPNYMLPLLLDIPIIRANSGDQNHPAGTGPYVFSASETPRLVASASYRDKAHIPTPVIYLKSCTDSELSVAFSSQSVDMFWDDPSDAIDINILSDHEIRYYDTTILEFVGFNTKKAILSNPELRRAIGLTVDREKIIDDVYSNHGVAAPVVLSPKFSLYDKEWEPKVPDPLGELSSIFNGIGPAGSGGKPMGMVDDDSNGYLEMPDANGIYQPFSLKLIVNKDNKYKVKAAQEIAGELRDVGIDVNLQALPWDSFMAALQSGDFDLYYGDVSLPADYDLTQLLSPGGSLDFGKAGSEAIVSRIDAFLGAADDEKRIDAARKLCDLIYTDAPIVPVLYRQFAVHTNRNIVAGLNPTQSSLFYGLMKWKINLG